MPGVMQKHRIRDFGAEAELSILENEIGDLRKAATDDGVVAGDLDVAFFDDVANGFWLMRHSRIVARVRECKLWLSPGFLMLGIVRDEWLSNKPADRRQRVQNDVNN